MASSDSDQQRREKQSKRFPGWSSGPASEGRRLAGTELEARARALEAVVSVSLKVAHQEEKARVGQKPMQGPPRPPAWLRSRLRRQRRLFDIDRPDRAV